MAVYLAPVGNTQYFDGSGNPLVGGKILTYLSRTTTPAATYTDNTGTVPQANPIIFNSLGMAASPIWLTGGISYTFVFQDAAGVTYDTINDIVGVNDPAGISVDQWVVYQAIPTYISASSFSVVGDQTNTFQIGRRVRTTNTGGTVYGTITGSSFAAGITTVTIATDSGVLDAGLSQVSYGLISAINSSIVVPVPRGQLSGLTMTTAGPSITMSIAPGQAANSTNARLMTLGTTLAKTTAAWSAGNAGGIDTGAIAINTWYHFYLIYNPTSGVTDVVFSLNATSPTLPAGYTQFRRIGSGRTNASSQWTLFSQSGDEFLWSVSVADKTSFTVGTGTRDVFAVTVPTGVQVNALMRCVSRNTTGDFNMAITSLDESDQSPGANFSDISGVTTSTGYSANKNIRTNTSAQIGTRATGANTILWIGTYGWIDSRGRNA